MVMSTEEILRSYRTAKSPVKQISILAELNACEKSEIAQLLADNGCPIPKWYKGVSAAATAQAETTQAETAEEPAQDPAEDPSEAPAPHRLPELVQRVIHEHIMGIDNEIEVIKAQLAALEDKIHRAKMEMNDKRAEKAELQKFLAEEAGE